MARTAIAVLIRHFGSEIDKKVELVICFVEPSDKDYDDPKLLAAFYGSDSVDRAEQYLRGQEAEIVERTEILEEIKKQYRVAYLVSGPGVCCEAIKKTFEADNDEAALVTAFETGKGLFRGNDIKPSSLVRIDQEEKSTIIKIDTLVDFSILECRVLF